MLYAGIKPARLYLAAFLPARVMSMEEQHEEESLEEDLELADAKIDALINLLIKKKVISEEEFQKEHENLYEE